MNTRNLALSALFFSISFAAFGCSSDADSANPSADAGASTDASTDADTNQLPTWECDPSHDGWEQCSDNRVQYCHIVTGMEPHFHWGADCVSLGLTCVDVDSSGNSACVDNNKPCAPTDQKCDQNTAYFCVNGKLAQEPCGTAKDCHANEGTPHCEEKGTECGGHGHLHEETCHCDTGYIVDPDDSKNCVAEVGFPEESCKMFATATTNEAVVTAFPDFPKAHADLDKPYTVTLPDNVPSYVHFPVATTGEYVLFLSNPGRFDAFMHRNGSEVAPPASGGVPNGKCTDQITDHWHATLSFDGSATDTKVPYIVRFKAIAGGGTVTFMLRKGE